MLRQLAFASLTFALVASAVLPHVAAAPAYGMQASRVDPALMLAYPGQTITVRAAIENVGVNDDTYTLSVSGDARYSPALAVSTVSVPAGSAAVVTYDVVAPSSVFLASFTLRIVSQNDVNVNRNLVTSVETPVEVVVTMNTNRLTLFGSDVAGVVSAKFLDGSPYAGATAFVRTNINTPTAVLIPSTSGTVTLGPDGKAAFDLGQAPQDHTPGRHTVTASVARPGASPATGSATYSV